MTAYPMPRWTPATAAQKAEYASRTPRPVYPLGGLLRVDSTLTLEVEDLRGSWSRPDPMWEAMAPAGFHFDGDDTHSLLATDLTDLRSRLHGASLAPCTATSSCNCGGRG